uniref:G-protein coupled receptors family 1 profile domain-containing protein n=1 Tax=Globodera rostochiensis TaxID=31243 RepID=A0A914I099_GLORO
MCQRTWHGTTTTAHRCWTQITTEFRVIPVFLVLSLLAILANALVIVALRSARVRQNATVTLLTSLTSSDIWSCIVMGLSLLYNSYLPIVLQTKVEPCLALSLEMLRTGGLLTAALHLLLIALHHCVGIIRPHYNKDHLRHGILWLCALSWVVPPGCLWLLALSRPNQGFWDCERPDFYHTRVFRWTVSALLGIIFCAITLCYAKLLYILRLQHEKWPQQQQKQQHRPSLFRDSRRSTTDAIPCGDVPPPALCASKRRRRERRTLWTTLLICASFLLGWAPASLLFALTCADCRVLASPDHYRVLFALSCTQLAFLLAKSLLNPLIYSLRIPEVNAHIHKCMTKCALFNCCRCDSKNGHFHRRMTAVSISGDVQRRKLHKRRNNLFVSSNSSLAEPDDLCRHQQLNNWGKTAAEMVKRRRRKPKSAGLLLLQEPTENGGTAATAATAAAAAEDDAFGDDEQCHEQQPRGTIMDKTNNKKDNDASGDERTNSGSRNNSADDRCPPNVGLN